MFKSLALALTAAVISSPALAFPPDSQPAELTAYAQCQLHMPEFDSFDHHLYQDDPRMAGCMALSDQITKDHFDGDIAQFHDFYRDNALAIIMEVKADYK